MKSLNLIFLLFIVSQSQAEVVLKTNKMQRISFDGDDLIVRMDHPYGIRGVFIMCLKSSSDADFEVCPQGYAQLILTVSELDKTSAYIIHRKGNVTPSSFQISGTLNYNKDGSIDVILAQLPEKMTITLVNAKKLSESQKETQTHKTAIIIGTIVGVIGLILFIAIISFVVWCFVFRRTTHTPVSTAIPVTEDQERGLHRAAKVTDTSSNPSTPTIETNQAAPYTTKLVDEDVKQPLIAKLRDFNITQPRHNEFSVQQLEGPLNVAAPIVETKPVKKITPTVSITTSKDDDAKQTTTSQKSVHVSTSKPLVVKKPMSPLLPVEKTQSPTEASPTMVTPDFGNDALTNELASNSAIKSRIYLARSEAPVFGSTKKRRSKPVVDEVQAFKLSTETIYCFGQREGLLSGHNHMMLVDRINVTKQHDISDAERALLKARAKDVPRLADIVVKEAEAAIYEKCAFNDHTRVSLNEKSDFWEFVNDRRTPASVGYTVIYKIMPELFALKENSMNDQLVQKLPLCGIYILMLDDKLPHKFRVELANDLRRRATMIILRLQQASFRDTAFPAPYLTLIYHKNSRSFVDGLEIHSRTSKKHRSKSAKKKRSKKSHKRRLTKTDQNTQ